MESALLSFGASTVTLMSTSIPRHSQLAHLSFGTGSTRFYLGSLVMGRAALRSPGLKCVKIPAAIFGSGGGGFGCGSSGGGGGRDGDGSPEGGDGKARAVSSGAEDVSALSSDVIVLEVGGMVCGGCAVSVKKILESQPQVSSASVNHKTETAIVWPVSEAKIAPNWKKDVGEALAKHLTACGFESNLRDQETIGGEVQA